MGEYGGIQDCIFDCINKCDLDLRRNYRIKWPKRQKSKCMHRCIGTLSHGLEDRYLRRWRDSVQCGSPRRTVMNMVHPFCSENPSFKLERMRMCHVYSPSDGVEGMEWVKSILCGMESMNVLIEICVLCC